MRLLSWARRIPFARDYVTVNVYAVLRHAGEVGDETREQP
jgi:hypothetical protein